MTTGRGRMYGDTIVDAGKGNVSRPRMLVVTILVTRALLP
jgi:hypothetical protein